MEIIHYLVGQGKDLNTLQMSFRGVIIFVLVWVLIRLSGRRSFGIRTPLDNIIVVLLGAVLSRAVVGASPFCPVLACSVCIVLLHRFISYMTVKSKAIAKCVEGEKIIVYQNGKFIKNNLDRALVCEEDVMQGVRKSALTDFLGQIDTIYIERNGEVTAIEKKK